MVTFEVIDQLPTIQDLQSIDNPIASELYASDSILIGRYFTENRSKLEADQLNDFYKNALIATEDIRFYKHSGVDYKSLLRVFFKSILLQRQGSGGGSTITQQLVKNLYPRKRYKMFSTILNKFREMSIASRLENIYSKDQILLLYSNTVSFGEGAFGLNTAAKRFFNKNPRDLLLEEAATLVGMLKATTYYSPRRFPDRARQRRNVVLSQMSNYGFIKEEVAEEVSKLPIKLSYQAVSEVEEFARYFKQFVKKEFGEWSSSLSKEDGSKYNLYRDGLKIYTSLDYEMQIVGEQNMLVHMSQLQKLFDQEWKGGKKFGQGTRVIDDKILADPYYKQLKEEGKTNKQALDVFTVHGNRELWTWDGIETKSATKIDSIKHYLSLLHAGVLAADPGSGKIKVYIGGNDFSRFQWDNVMSPRQAGSVFKPIVYLTALEKGVNPCDYYKNELRTYNDYQDWAPRNANEEYGGYLPVYQALMHSVNTVSVQLLFEAGIPSVIEVAKELGIKSPLSGVPSIVLGTSDVSLFEMVRAYSVLANKGKVSKLRSIERIEDIHGNILYQEEPSEEEYADIDPENAEILNAMLTNVTKAGTGRRIYSNYSIPFELMGKTGTTQNQSDGWFIAYTDNLVVGAWVGAQDRRIHFRSLSSGAGGRTALPLVGAIFEYAASEGLRPNITKRDIEFECLEFLSDEEYEFLQSRGKETDIKDLYYRRKLYGQSNQNDSSHRPMTDEEKKLEKERAKRIKKYNRAKKKWEKKLKRMRKKG
jgi:penicillin-binding protein 1A